MAQYEVEGPDGTIYDVEAADDNAARAKVRQHIAGGAQQPPETLARPEGPVDRLDHTYERPEPGADDPLAPKTPQAVSAGYGALDSAMLSAQDELRGVGGGIHALMTGNDPKYAYDYVKGHAEADSQKAQRDNPVSFGAGQIGGSLALPTGKVGSARQAMAILGGYGAAHGFGSGDSIEDRFKKAGVEGAGSAILGGGAHAVTAPLIAAAANKASAASGKLLQFDRAGVRPTAAALAPEDSMAPGMTKGIAENFFSGGRTRAALLGSVDDTNKAVQRVAGNYGSTAPVEVVGQNVREGVANWAWSFKDRAEDIYAKALGPLMNAPAEARATQYTIGDIINRVTPNTASSGLIIPKQMTKIAEALTKDQGKLNFGDLRAWRTWVREAQKEPSLAQGIDAASLQRLESALTDDIYRSAQSIGGPQALRKLQQADQFYTLGQQRIKTALAPFADPRGTPASAYQRIVGLASSGGRQNTQALLALKRSLPADQWRDVAASIISHMGETSPGVFSPSAFLKTYESKMTPDGRAILFGARGGGNGPATQLSAELDNLAEVARMQGRVEQMANHSGSGRSLQNVTALGLLFGPTAPFVAAGFAGQAITGEALTNPLFVRWLATSGRAGSLTPQAVRQLGSLAARDPALQPVYQAVADQGAKALSAQSPAPEKPRQAAGSRR